MRVKLHLAAAIVVCVCGLGLRAQLTDDTGLITSSNWLVPGPFASPFGCGSAEDMLGNHIAPSYIGCLYPEEFEEVEYDEGLAVSTGYGGADPEPVWRRFDDGDINLDADVNADLSDHMSWLATYIEYAGDGPVFVELCVGGDDRVQVFVDDQPASSADLGCDSSTSCE